MQEHAIQQQVAQLTTLRAAMRHRLLLSFTAEAEGRSADDVVDALLRALPAPDA